ncbi:L-serine ammonia-lyase, iron-sulfur-dependent, subunit alpha [Paenibacillus sp. N1-5-1-14]|uniref:L-cysteine desulfidase family protein n=1 Tax=Paenibacillus radicibacter TaxID=2972488 RepID=UPI00215915A3|nr:L-serine ammonia-lyase, iron-sulfur-dependent, subunit alpha [Paenibacillus radicibacter]MCR8644867.1 L-serine ammonia-lyase, iron-sulfur-dependent, subunit alpha [Paenibacillus radicibacter]
MNNLNEQMKQLLQKELVVALGCTEPIAIAYAAAVAKSHLKEEITSIDVIISANVMKNAMAVGIPGMKQTGIDFVAALGAIAGDPDRQLEVLKEVPAGAEEQAAAIVKEEKVKISLTESPKKLYIEICVHTTNEVARVIIEDLHTNISKIEVNGRILLDKECESFHDKVDSEEDIYNVLTFESIYQYVLDVPLEELELVKSSIELNLAICEEGLNNSYGLQVGKILKENVERKLLSDDVISHAMALTSAGSDARMAGIMLPVMSNSGSGNQGIAVTMPVVAVAQKLEVSEETMIRAVTFSHLLAIWIKSKFGRLSALCGVTVAGASAAAAITYLLGGNVSQMSFAIQNTIGNVTGMLCDGAKAGCAMKVSTCSGAAVQSALLATSGMRVSGTNGIIEEGLEETIDNFCRLGNEGSTKMDELMLDMMLNKRTK